MAKLKRLKINKFRNVEPVELHFSDGFNVLLGINGSGKTTLLELIVAVLSRDLSAIQEEEFEVEYQIELETVTFEAVLENSARSPGEGLNRGANGRRASRRAEAAYHFRGTVRMGEGADPSEPWRKLSEDDWEELSFSMQGRYPLSVIDSMETLEHASRFDESTDFFRSLFDARTNASSTFTTIGDRYDPDGGIIFMGPREQVSNALKRAMIDESAGKWPAWREPHLLRFDMDKLPFVRDFVRLAGLKNGWLDVRLLQRSTRGGDDTAPYLTFGDLEFWFERLDDSRVRGDKLSHGQKRLLAFLYYLDCNPHIVIADELTNGLHHAWITACLQAIGDRQAFLANQDPLLLDELEFSSAEDVKRAFILCRCDTSSGKERLVWSNMSDYDAERFFEAYNVGLQHVSEILRDKNLW
ncbi:AAA family ATPase [Polyangium mundeleinium]|uniref:AAA family ATPase n=1 Tax=Polyangium mundeleinium TaxID=2995306 RepID=A0ABT5EJE7_9BACT|nr:AAA family ATPase [Polyangium mundeleinium]MDC0741928.1 AAA family ATPase [Polyangium mundeleinium]